MDFDTAFELLVGHEGKLSTDRNDRGNWTSGIVGVGEFKGTKYGISAMSYPHLDIKNLTLDQAKAIYLQDFWLRLKLNEFDPVLRYCVFDSAVNNGPGNAARFLQRAVDVADDGDIGPITRAAVKSHHPYLVLLRFTAERHLHNAKLSTWHTNGRGWTIRVATIQRDAVPRS